MENTLSHIQFITYSVRSTVEKISGGSIQFLSSIKRDLVSCRLIQLARSAASTIIARGTLEAVGAGRGGIE